MTKHGALALAEWLSVTCGDRRGPHEVLGPVPTIRGNPDDRGFLDNDMDDSLIRAVAVTPDERWRTAVVEIASPPNDS